jgi:arylsulfatase
VRWTGKIKPGQDIDRIAAHIDILPTLASLSGAKLPENQVEGRSLLPLLEGRQAGWEDRFVFNHVCRWPTGADPDDYKDANFSVRNQRYRYVGPSLAAGRNKKAGSSSGAALYDMQADPGQTKNILAEQPEIAARMQAAYDQYWKEARPLMVNETAPMSPTRPYHEWFQQQKSSIGIPDWQSPSL